MKQKVSPLATIGAVLAVVAVVIGFYVAYKKTDPAAQAPHQYIPFDRSKATGREFGPRPGFDPQPGPPPAGQVPAGQTP